MSSTEAKQATLNDGWLRNRFGRGVTPSINILPLEILIRIFSDVCNVRSNACPVRMDYDNPDRTNRLFSNKPTILSHVCSYWRQIVVSLASLWSHIDVLPDRICDPLISARLEAYLTRSAEALLDIHVIVPFFRSIPEDRSAAISFFTVIAPRIRSLTVQTACGIYAGGFCGEVISFCLENCVPGTLIKLSMETVVTEEWGSIIFGRIRKPSRTTTEWDIEDVLLQLTTLRLNSFHISWGSKAYHGLAELRLNDNFRLSRPEFMNILISSPQLRILEIGRLYERFLEASSPNTPIRLDNLEILALGKVTDNFLGSVLRLIVPGTRPLSLSIMNPYQNGSEFSSKEELQNFVARSNVTRLCTNGFAGYSQLAEVLSLMPTVRTLGVDQFMCDAIDDESTLPLILQIDALYVLNSTRSCAFTWSSIEEFTKKHDVRALTLWNYNFRHSGIGKAGEETVPDNLHTICPVVILVPNTEPNPIEEWD